MALTISPPNNSSELILASRSPQVFSISVDANVNEVLTITVTGQNDTGLNTSPISEKFVPDAQGNLDIDLSQMLRRFVGAWGASGTNYEPAGGAKVTVSVTAQDVGS